MVRALSLESKGPEFDPSVRPSVVKIANHFNKVLCRCFARKAGPSLIAVIIRAEETILDKRSQKNNK